MFGWLRMLLGGFKPPQPVGPPKQVRAIRPGEDSVCGSAHWADGELEVSAETAGPLRLFEIPVSGLDQCMVTYRYRIKTDGLQSSVYPEMWCRIPGLGEFFSRGLHLKMRGSNHWPIVEIPFYLKRGQAPDLLKLNLVFEGPGAVKLKEIEVLATPLAE